MIYLSLFVLSFVLTYFIKVYAVRKSLLAEVNERSSHTVPTPHGGGIAIVVAWFLGLIYLFYIHQIDNRLFYALMVGIIISIVSFLDDIYELPPKFRFFAQSFVAVCGLYFLGGLTELNLFLFSIKNPIINNIFAFLLIVWFINLYNFLDGIDGYAASEAIFLGISGYLIFGGNHFLILIVSVLGFLFWNWHRAKIFMGDVGSTLLGYTVGIFTLYYSNIESGNLWIWVILFGIFWFDATLTLFRRFRNGEKLSQAHKKHAYQRLVQAGWKHDKVVLSALIINVLLLCLAYFVKPVLLAFIISLFILFSAVKFSDLRKKF